MDGLEKSSNKNSKSATHRQGSPCSSPPLPSSIYPYTITGVLGKGTYGIVYRASDAQRNEVALKTITLENTTEGVPSTALREIAAMQHIRHPNVLRLLRVYSSPQALSLAFELADFDLRRYLDAYGSPLSARRTKSFMYQLLQGIQHVHQLMILHRDIKPQNLLTFANGVIKIADFGLSRVFSVPVREFAHEVVTLWYRPPDILLGNQHYDTGVDIWSIGCVFAEMIEGRPLLSGLNVTAQLTRIFEVLGTPSPQDMQYFSTFTNRKLIEDISYGANGNLHQALPHADPYALDLLQKMLTYDEKKRISAKDALNHSYFSVPPKVDTIPLHQNHIVEAKKTTSLIG